jgi:hypothetical protein
MATTPYTITRSSQTKSDQRLTFRPTSKVHLGLLAAAWIVRSLKPTCEPRHKLNHRPQGQKQGQQKTSTHLPIPSIIPTNGASHCSRRRRALFSPRRLASKITKASNITRRALELARFCITPKGRVVWLPGPGANQPAREPGQQKKARRAAWRPPLTHSQSQTLLPRPLRAVSDCAIAATGAGCRLRALSGSLVFAPKG